MDLEYELKGKKPLYSLPRDNVVDDVINPALSVATEFSLMSGFFSVGVLKDLSHGLAKYLAKDGTKVRILISPELSANDQDSLREGLDPHVIVSRIVKEAFESSEALESALVQHAKECLAYLLAHDRLEIRVVLMRKGLFHPKTWIFEDGKNSAVLSGSANATHNGLGLNIEQLDLNTSWNGDTEAARCRGHKLFFDFYWDSSGTVETKTVSISYALLKGLLKPTESSEMPSFEDYQRALAEEFANQVSQKSEEEFLWDNHAFEIPNTLIWETGLYVHQGKAVKAWEENGQTGTLEMATGAGKTITSLIAAQRLFSVKKKLFLLVAVPTKVLLEQWDKDFREFGLRPYLALGKTQSQHLQSLEILFEALDQGLSDVESAIVTHDFMKNPSLRELLEAHGQTVMFVADEVHNLGTDSFIGNAPNVTARLGLSATLERQYDPEGSQALVEYFGKVVFSFKLDDAIGVCLVPYNYELEEVTLTEDEMEEYIAKTKEIGKILASTGGNPTGSSKQRLNILYKLRRRVLEAAEHKIGVLEQALRAIPPEELSHTLIYCTASNPRQLEQVNELLSRLNIRFYQVTQLESGGRLVSGLLKEFRAGGLKVLTAKKVLDEGFNVPEIKRAFLLASSSVEREWTQRRGRVLRMSPGKKVATIYDFVARPLEGYLDAEGGSKFMKPELKRVEEFRRLASNRDIPGGPTEKLVAWQLEFNVSLVDEPAEREDDGQSVTDEEISNLEGQN
jgi:superfamily II DNA or RNA helicase/HKD family nuclease